MGVLATLVVDALRRHESSSPHRRGKLDCFHWYATTSVLELNLRCYIGLFGAGLFWLATSIRFGFLSILWALRNDRRSEHQRQSHLPPSKGPA